MYIKLTGICNLQHVAECDQMQVLPTFKGLTSTELQSAQSFAGLRRRNFTASRFSEAINLFNLSHSESHANTDDDGLDQIQFVTKKVP